jgi:hypothetical protein
LNIGLRSNIKSLIFSEDDLITVMTHNDIVRSLRIGEGEFLEESRYIHRYHGP